MTINLRNGNGYWAVPYAINGQDIQYAEEGQLINGLREGIWYSAAGANIEVSGDYVHGKRGIVAIILIQPRQANFRSCQFRDIRRQCVEWSLYMLLATFQPYDHRGNEGRISSV